MIEFYDAVYRANPEKWGGGARDEFAYQSIKPFVSDPASLIDLGCGNGHTLRYFMDRWPETDFYGVDLSKVALEIAHKKVPGAFLTGTLDLIPRVNVITMLGVLEHFEDLSGVREVADHLSPAGILYIEVPNCLSYSNSKEEGFRKTYGAGRSGQMEWHLTRLTWETTLLKYGLKIVKSLTGKNPAWEFAWILQ